MHSLEILTQMQNIEINKLQTEERKNELENLIDRTKIDMIIQVKRGNIRKAENLKRFMEGLVEAKKILLLS